MKRIWMVGIIAGGCLLFNGCKAENADLEAINSEIEESNEAEPVKENERKAEAESGNSGQTETEPETEFAYGEMTEDFYLEIEDTFALLEGGNVVVVGMTQNSPLYVNTEVDVINDGKRLESSIGGIEVYQERVDGVEAGKNIGVMLTELDKDDVCAGDIIVLRGCENPKEKLISDISEKAEEILATEISEEKAYIPAYVEVIQQQEAEYDIPNRLSYDFIYLNEDEIPELVVGVSGYWVSVYTYADEEVYTVMDGWGYGAMGNSGYDYLPQENVIRNYNTDLAGVILYTTYCRMDDNHEIEVFCSLRQSRLDEEGNYPRDSEAFENAKWHYFYGEQEVAGEEYDSYVIPGDYAAVIGSKTAMEMLEEMYEMSYAE